MRFQVTKTPLQNLFFLVLENIPMLRFSRKFEKLFSKRLLSSNESALAEKMKATETVYPLQKTTTATRYRQPLRLLNKA